MGQYKTRDLTFRYSIIPNCERSELSLFSEPGGIEFRAAVWQEMTILPGNTFEFFLILTIRNHIYKI